MQHDPPPQPPQVVSATWNGATRRVTIVFDMDILPAVLDLTNWILSYSGGTANPTSSTIEDEKVVLQFEGVAGVSQIEYAPPPFDVIGINGVPAEAFVEPL